MFGNSNFCFTFASEKKKVLPYSFCNQILYTSLYY